MYAWRARADFALCLVEQGFLYLSLPAAPASAILSWSSALHSCRARLQRGARSQRTIKKSTKNKLRSAYPSPFRARTLPSLAQGELYSLPSACCNLSGVCGRECGSLPSSPSRPCPSPRRPSLSLFFFSFSFSTARSPRASRRPRGPSRSAPRRFSSLFFSWFVWGRSWRSRIRKTVGGRGEGEDGEKSERGKNRVHAGPVSVAMSSTFLCL